VSTGCAATLACPTRKAAQQRGAGAARHGLVPAAR
jgi:hypothetical protein